MKKLSKIVVSVGPNSEDPKILRQIMESGADLFRLNFSHDTGELQGKRIDNIRKIAAKLGQCVGIIADLQGPKHRIGNFETDAKYPLAIGAEFTLDNNSKPGDGTRVQLPDADVLKSLHVGDHVLLNDGKIELEVTKTKLGAVTTRVLRGTEIWSRRGFNLPDTEIDMEILTDKDKRDLEYAITKNPEYVAVSFVQSAGDIAFVRDFIAARTAAPIKIIAKIERPQAVERIEEIADVCDAIMIARGDLAVEVPFEKMPAIQRHLIRTARKKNKPIIVATQMLASMVSAEFPLRSEISDVATAAYLRTDATMTSEETTIGEHPVGAIDVMAKILAAADEDSRVNNYDWNRIDNLPENDWSRSVSSIAFLNHAVAIVVFSRDGLRVRAISCRRPDIPIVAVSNDEMVANQLCLSRGVFPIYSPQIFGQRDAQTALDMAGISRGKIVIADAEEITLKDI